MKTKKYTYEELLDLYSGTIFRCPLDEGDILELQGDAGDPDREFVVIGGNNNINVGTTYRLSILKLKKYFDVIRLVEYVDDEAVIKRLESLVDELKQDLSNNIDIDDPDINTVVANRLNDIRMTQHTIDLLLSQ
jgi:hypothetical protein